MLRAESSGLLWDAAGGLTDDEELDQKQGKQPRGSTTVYPVASTSSWKPSEPLAAANDALKPAVKKVNTRPTVQKRSDEDENIEEQDEEFTYNPDAELQDAQADSHAAYEGQQFYEKVQFGEFSKYMANKRRKLGVQQGATRRNADNSNKSELLKGLRIHINGETEPPAHVLSNLVVLHGGVYVPYLDAKKTSATHIIATTLTPSKRVAFKEYKVVKPEWLTESIRDMKVKDWRHYREDQAAVRASDIGVAPAGTQIAQPKLSFVGQTASSASVSTPKPFAGSKTAQASPNKASTPIKTVSPRRLPPPTSDPISVLHAQSAADPPSPVAAGGPPQPPYITEGWYNTKSNAKSAELLKDERWRLNETAVNTTEFLEKYYKESRLHWLSTWKAELKKLVGELSEKQGKTVEIGDGLPKKKKLKGTHEDGRTIMHIDFDSFFVSASLLARPHLKGQPVVVCHASVGDSNSSSEIASASYEARAFGIKNGMSLGSARTRCPQVQTVPYDFELYRAISAKFYTILFSHALELEAVSIDEAYISLPPVTPPRTGQQLLDLAEGIRSEIREATGLETSVGVSHNKLLARLATNRAKPCSSFQIGNGVDPSGESLAAFLKDIDIESLPQIGWKKATDVEEKLKDLNKRLKQGHFAQKDSSDATKQRANADAEEVFGTVGKLLGFQKNSLKEVLGEKTGEMLYNYARGIDSRELETETVRKSVSAEVNYGIRFKSHDEVEKFCHGLGGEVASRLAKLGYKGRQLTLKVMRRAEQAPIEPPKFLGHGVCDTFNASKPMELTNEPILIGRTAWELMRTLACPPEELRGIGLQMQKLENAKSTITSSGGIEGQGRLSFQSVNKGKASQQEDSVQVGADMQQLPPHTPIVVGESSSPQVTVERIPGQTVRARSARSRQPVNYIDLATSDSEGAMDRDEDLTLLSQAPAHLREAGQSLLGGRVTKRSASGSLLPKTKAIVIPATSPAIVLPDTSTTIISPAKLTDKNLFTLGLDSIFFQSCSRKTQVELLQEVLAKRGEDNEEIRSMLIVEKGKKGKKKKKKPLFAPVFEQAAENAAKREAARIREQKKREKLARGPVFYRLDLPLGMKAPSFAKQSDTSGVCQILSQWMEGVGKDHAPALEEVQEFSKFCMESMSIDPAKNGGRGSDVAKVCAILQWWDYLISQRERQQVTSGSQRAATAAWRDAQVILRRQVNEIVETVWGAPLSTDC